MGVAYVDTSVFAAIAFNEPGSEALVERLGTFDRVASSILLEAELRSALFREGYALDSDFLSGMEWILPDRPLTEEIGTVLRAGYLRGADLLHVATALYAARDSGQMAFLTLDSRLRSVSQVVGFES